MRFIRTEEAHGYPHRLTHEGLQVINTFAQAELSAMVASGRNAQSASLPLTDTQKARQKGEHKRAAAAKAAARGGKSQTPPPTAAATVVDGIRHSSTTSSRATPCTSWAKGPCHRGINCWFKHEGIPTHTKDNQVLTTCVVCRSKDHTSAQCRAPGGKLDPDHDKNWEKYRERKAKAAENQKGKGKDAQQQAGQGKGGKKGAGKRRDSRGPKGGKKGVAAEAIAGQVPPAAAAGALAASSATPGAPAKAGPKIADAVVGQPTAANATVSSPKRFPPRRLRARFLGERVPPTRSKDTLHQRLE